MLLTFYVNKLSKVDEIDNFLERHKLSKLTQEEIENQTRPKISKEV